MEKYEHFYDAKEESTLTIVVNTIWLDYLSFDQTL